MKNLINQLHRSDFLGKIFHTLDYELKRELSNCESVLDIGCGPSSPLQHCHNVRYSVGVEAFKPYIEESKKKKIHTKYINKKIEELNFPEKSFDAVIMIEVIEHLNKKEVLELINKAEKWAIKKIIISTPNGFISQKDVDNNPLQKHLSGWDIKEMASLGYKCRGLAGLKCLRDNSEKKTMSDGDLTASIRFQPKMFWFLVATLSQVFTYHYPPSSFELFGVKTVISND